jgi:hypothetical protein
MTDTREDTLERIRELEAQAAILQAAHERPRGNTGFAHRLAALINREADTYEQAPIDPRWKAPRLDTARRLAIVVASTGDKDSKIRLIAGATHNETNCMLALRMLMDPVPDAAVEALDAAKKRTPTSLPAYFGNAEIYSHWLEEQAAKRVVPDVDYWLHAMAVAAHDAEHEQQAKEIDRLKLELHKERQNPDERLAPLQARIGELQAEAEHLRQHSARAQASEGEVSNENLRLQAKVRKLEAKLNDPMRGLKQLPNGTIVYDQAAAAHFDQQASVGVKQAEPDKAPPARKPRTKAAP